MLNKNKDGMFWLTVIGVVGTLLGVVGTFLQVAQSNQGGSGPGSKEPVAGERPTGTPPQLPDHVLVVEGTRVGGSVNAAPAGAISSSGEDCGMGDGKARAQGKTRVDVSRSEITGDLNAAPGGIICRDSGSKK